MLQPKKQQPILTLLTPMLNLEQAAELVQQQIFSLPWLPRPQQ